MKQGIWRILSIILNDYSDMIRNGPFNDRLYYRLTVACLITDEFKPFKNNDVKNTDPAKINYLFYALLQAISKVNEKVFKSK